MNFVVNETRTLMRYTVTLAALFLTACGNEPAEPITRLYPGETPELRVMINETADANSVPRSLVHRVIQRESDYRPNARNGPYYGLMQILPATARQMGFRGQPSDLLDAQTNLT